MSRTVTTNQSPSGLSRRSRRSLPVAWLVWFVALVVLLPVLVVVFRALEPAGDMWGQIVENRLPGYLWQTLLLVTLVTLFAVLFGVPSAWYVSVHEFPGRKWFEWVLLLPLAMPGFVAATAYVDTFNHLIPFYIWIRDQFGIEAFLYSQKIVPWVFAVLVLSSTLFPYVFLSCRAVFAREAASSLEASRMLGSGSLRTFLVVALPMARPAVVAGASLVAMEAINDYGVVSYFGLSPLTPGIFRAWSEGAIGVAMRLSLILMAVALIGLGIERWQRGRKKFVTDMLDIPLSRRHLSWFGVSGAWFFCMVPLTLGFILPAVRMARWAMQSLDTIDWKSTLVAGGNSFMLASGSALLIIVGGLVIVAGRRIVGHSSLLLAQRIGVLGYTFPSALVAVGVGAMVSFLSDHVPGAGVLALSASAFGIMLAYFVRFLAVGIQPTAAGFERISSNLSEAARTLGTRPVAALFRIELPLVWPALIAGATLAFMDVFKELTITLVLRPFNFETLATHTYRLTDEGRIPEAAIPALSLVLFSLLGLIPLTRMLRQASRKKTAA